MDMGFNLTAFVDPQTPAEYSALLDEALRLLDELNEVLDKIASEE